MESLKSQVSKQKKKTIFQIGKVEKTGNETEWHNLRKKSLKIIILGVEY